MSTGSGAKPSNEEKLSVFWSVVYISMALLISFLYYLNPGLWRLIENVLDWLVWVRAFLY